MRVLVIGLNGRGLAPTTPRKARILVSSGKAKVVRKVPYTIQLLYKTGVAGGSMKLGIDTGSQHIGVAVVQNGRAVIRAEYSLRSTMEKRSLLETRREYRRGRRYRKTRYRHPKFRFHTKRIYSDAPVKKKGRMGHWMKCENTADTGRSKGWLPPSIQSKVDHHIRIIHHYLDALPDGSTVRIEVGRFDAARMQDPDIHGEMYQHGKMYDYENRKAYVFDRDGYKCRICKAKAGSRRKDGSVVKLIVHHIDFRSKAASDNPDRLMSVCDRCHTSEAHKKGGILYDMMVKGKKFARGYRDAVFMNIIRTRLLKEFPHASFTYGNITSADRKTLLLEKTHANDAVAIATGPCKIYSLDETVYYGQVRSRKRSLHEANPRKGRSHSNRTASRNRKNTKSVTVRKNGKPTVFHVYDRVRLNGKAGWISGFTGSSAYVKDEYDRYITYEGKSYKQVNLSDLAILSHNNNWLLGARKQIGK